MSDAPLPAVEEPIDQELIDAYADLAGDYNPLHVDPEAAARSEFGGTIAHGPVGLQAFFRSLVAWSGGAAPPAGTEVRATFLRPVRPGDTISCHERERTAGGERLEIAAECVNQDAATVIAVRAAVPAAAQ
ncbi:MAG: MaoC family dehydratase [Solirubrobacterales bacterium]